MAASTRGGGFQPLGLPGEAALDHPVQDRRPLGLELGREVGIAVLRGNDHRERDEQESSAYRLSSPTKEISIESGLDEDAPYRQRLIPGAASCARDRLSR